MYGYIRPFKPELKMREYERYRAEYCGLCTQLARRYGYIARYLISYDMTFASLALGAFEPAGKPEFRRCPASPYRKKCMFAGETEARLFAADASVILAWWKLDDDIHDEGFFKRVRARVFRAVLRGAFTKAKGFRPEFSDMVKESMNNLSKLESAGERSLDKTADLFASAIAGMCEARSEISERRILREMLYQAGRVVYMLDAADDIKDDMARGRYNAAAARFAIEGECLSSEAKDGLRENITMSLASAVAAAELLPDGEAAQIIKNILYAGMSGITEDILEGGGAKRRTTRDENR